MKCEAKPRSQQIMFGQNIRTRHLNTSQNTRTRHLNTSQNTRTRQKISEHVTKHQNTSPVGVENQGTVVLLRLWLPPAAARMDRVQRSFCDVIRQDRARGEGGIGGDVPHAVLAKIADVVAPLWVPDPEKLVIPK